MKHLLPGFVAVMGIFAAAHFVQSAAPPLPYGPVPSKGQLQWHELEFYGFVHFTVNTFTDKEWGYGDEPESRFNPTNFSADQIARTFKEAGMKALILTCKHHDGFCLWPSKYTEHSVKKSPWKEGHGDIVRELSEACQQHGLKFGVYLSPWDRNHAEYARPAYIEYYRNQLRELLTQYGPIFELWCDGANGGDGYYGGARETRKIDASKYYDWPNTWALAYQLQPNLVVFSDAGPQVRWVGNESGEAGDPCWATYTPHGLNGADPAPGLTKYQEGFNGQRDGKYWMPAEVDVSIRPGWFYHASEDGKVRSPENLLKLYFQSVGRGANLLLNVPPDRRGQIHENDVAALRAFKKRLDDIFTKDMAGNATVIASNVRGKDRQFAGQKVLDHQRDTYWCTDDEITTPTLELSWPQAVTFNVVSLREYLPLGQRVDSWALDRWDGGHWIEFAQGQSIGNRRLWKGEPQTTDRVRLRIVKAPVCPALAELAIFFDGGR
jgi:alpha-L-fucosidase